VADREASEGAEVAVEVVANSVNPESQGNLVSLLSKEIS
jgi:hypothetical protein